MTDQISRAAGRVVQRSRHFGPDQDGGLTVISLLVLAAVLLISGAAIDIRHSKTPRAHLQTNMGSAAPAAARLDQRLDAGDVVKSYFEKNGLDSDLLDIRQNLTAIGGGEGIAPSVTADYRGAAQRRQKKGNAPDLESPGSIHLSERIDDLRQAVKQVLRSVLNAG